MTALQCAGWLSQKMESPAGKTKTSDEEKFVTRKQNVFQPGFQPHQAAEPQVPKVQVPAPENVQILNPTRPVEVEGNAPSPGTDPDPEANESQADGQSAWSHHITRTFFEAQGRSSSRFRGKSVR